MAVLILVRAMAVAAHPDRGARAASVYATLSRRIYTCVRGDNSVALNGLLANGGEVKIAAATCNLGHGLMMTVSGTRLVGVGMGRTILHAMKPERIDVITVGIAAVNYRGGGFAISDFTVDGDLRTHAAISPTSGQNIVIMGGVHAEANHSFGITLSNVETRFGVNGVAIHGSDIRAVGLKSHGNRHSGFFVMGLATIPAPYNIAHNVTLTGSWVGRNNLDNRVGLTWDDIDISKFTADVTIGGLNPGDGNTIVAGDILLGCPPTDWGCGESTGPFLVQGNSVTNLGPVQSLGMRAYGNVRGATFDHNTVVTAETGIGVYGNAANTRVTGQCRY